jgi:outer membrane lipoprotein-sorting protein
MVHFKNIRIAFLSRKREYALYGSCSNRLPFIRSSIAKVRSFALFILLSIIFQLTATSQDATPLVNKVKAKLDRVKDYVAEGRMKTDVAFIKAPAGKVKIFYKTPNKFRLKRDGGISLLPKGGVSVNMNSVLTDGNFMALAAGESIINGTKLKVVKLLPSNENSDVVLTTLYIDELNLLIRKATTTTRENGTYEMEMNYGRYAEYSLPDKVIFAFNTKDYKLPKGITMEFDSGEKKAGADKMKGKKGKVEINYSSYIINKGVSDAEFK